MTLPVIFAPAKMKFCKMFDFTKREKPGLLGNRKIRKTERNAVLSRAPGFPHGQPVLGGNLNFLCNGQVRCS